MDTLHSAHRCNKLRLNVKCPDWSWRARKHFYVSNAVSRQKVKKLLSDQKARKKRWRILWCVPLVEKLLTSCKIIKAIISSLTETKLGEILSTPKMLAGTPSRQCPSNPTTWWHPAHHKNKISPIATTLVGMHFHWLHCLKPGIKAISYLMEISESCTLLDQEDNHAQDSPRKKYRFRN